MGWVGHQHGNQADLPPLGHGIGPSLTLSREPDQFLGGRSGWMFPVGETGLEPQRIVEI